jgi:hypothetical protein
VVNIDDDNAPDAFLRSDPIATAPVLITPHQLRDSFTNRGVGPQKIEPDPADPAKTKLVPACTPTDPLPSAGGGLAGGPRASAPPAQTPPTNTLSLDLNPTLPRYEQLTCVEDAGSTLEKTVLVSEVEFGAPAVAPKAQDPAQQLPSRSTVFPDLKTVLNEAWTMTYEGTLSLDSTFTSVDGPSIRSGTVRVDGQGMHLIDKAEPFCDMGVEPGDIVDFRGCNPANLDRDCPANYTCFVHPKSNVPFGACMLKTEAPRLSDACFDFLTTLRRYTVDLDPVKPGELVLLDRKHELATTPVDGCVSDDQCNQLASLAAKLTTPAPTDPVGSWRCLADNLRKPINPTDPSRNKRCVQVCTTDQAHTIGCATGTTCRSEPSVAEGGVCFEGVEPPQSCVNGPQHFDVRASEAFTVIGQRSGYLHPFIKKDGVCTRDPALDPKPPVQIGRFGLTAPPCVPGSDPLTGQLPGSAVGFEPNPCLLTAPQFENVPNYVDLDKCTVDAMKPTKQVQRAAPAIRFRNRAMNVTIVDPTYPGDNKCFLDRMGGLGNIPYVVRGYQLVFQQRGGYSPFALPLVGLVYPVKVVRGPTESIWVIDDGDFQATSITEASTRGRVFRIEAADTGVVNIMQ